MDIHGREFRQHQAYMASGHCSCLSVFILNKVTAGAALKGESLTYGFFLKYMVIIMGNKFKLPVKFSPYNLVNKVLK